MAKFYLETYGCKLNQADSDLIRGVLKKEFQEASENEADFFVLNTCGVLERTETKILKRAKQLKQKGKKLILTGCLPLVSFEACKKLADGMIGPTNVLAIARVVQEVLLGKNIEMPEPEQVDKAQFCFFQNKKNDCSTIISVGEGCVGHCSFCATRLARGPLKSFGIENILSKVRAALGLGFKEIHLTAQDLSCYGQDKGYCLLPTLLKEITRLRGDFRMKVGMLEPQSLKSILPDLIPVFKSSKIYNFFHIPMQSGDDSILEAMNRKYKAKEFLEIVEMFEKHFDDYLLATDVIVGFPNETEKQFNNTVKLIKKSKPHIVNINRFSSRPGTEAGALKDFPDRIKKERSRVLNQVCDKIKIQKNKKYLGQEYQVLVIKKSKNNTFLSRNEIGKAIILKKGKVGTFQKVKIIGFKPHYLIGKLV